MLSFENHIREVTRNETSTSQTGVTRKALVTSRKEVKPLATSRRRVRRQKISLARSMLMSSRCHFFSFSFRSLSWRMDYWTSMKNCCSLLWQLTRTSSQKSIEKWGGAVANRLRRRTSDQTVLGSNPAVAAALSPWTRLFTPIVLRRSLHISFY